MTESDSFVTTWAMHVKAPEEMLYAGFLFDIVYDGSEVTDLALMPAGVHFGIENSGGNGLSSNAKQGNRRKAECIWFLQERFRLAKFVLLRSRNSSPGAGWFCPHVGRPHLEP